MTSQYSYVVTLPRVLLQFRRCCYVNKKAVVFELIVLSSYTVVSRTLHFGEHARTQIKKKNKKKKQDKQSEEWRT